MADESVLVSSVYSIPPPPPPLAMSFDEVKNLMKSPASLIGKETLRSSVVDECKNFLRLHCHRNPGSKELSWYYYNNDISACLQDGPTYVYQT